MNLRSSFVLFTLKPMMPLLKNLCLFLTGISCLVQLTSANSLPAWQAGPYAVAMSHLEVKEQPDNQVMLSYLLGQPSEAHYVRDILLQPEATPTVIVQVPDQPERYGSWAGKTWPVVLLIAYPTTESNPRTDYEFPYTDTGDRTLSHMHQPGDQPLFAEVPGGKFPLIMMSGGYRTHSLWYIHHMRAIAQQGYIVVDLFHGDGRETEFAAALALRSLAFKAALDYVLAHPDYGPSIDVDRMGAVGESGGGHTVLTALGGFDPKQRLPAVPDPRIKAAVGVVPFMGASFGFWPSAVDGWYFGKNHAGLSAVSKPYLAIYGGKDKNVKPKGVMGGIRAVAGPSMAVRLPEEAHLFSHAAHQDARTWELLFLDAFVRNNPAARAQLAVATEVAGGARDEVTYRKGIALP